MYNRGLFHKWVSGIGTLALIVLLLAIFLLSNPINMVNVGQMVGSKGIMTEFFMFGNFACTIGMALILPMILRIKMRFRSKELMITSLIIMSAMIMVIATTSSGEVIVGASLIFGAAKMIGMIEVILPVQFILSSSGHKMRFYTVFYPIAIISGQLSGFSASLFSLTRSWQAPHFYAAGILLLAALVCLIFMHNQRFAKKMPLYYVDWLGIMLFATALMCMAYVFSFGKQQNWFISHNIQIATITAIVTIAALILRQIKTKHPFLSFKLYKRSDVLVGLLLLVGQGMYIGSSSIMSIYTSAILEYNWMTNSSIGLMMIPGMIAAGFVAFHWTKHQIPIKMYIFSGFAANFLYTVMLYFMMVPNLNIEQLFLPQILYGYGMCSLFISIWIYIFDKVSPEIMLPSVAPIMVFRSFVTISFFTALFGWLQYKLQWQSVGNLSFYFDTITMNNNPGTVSIRDIQLGAVLAANKTLLGYIIIAGLGFLIFIFFHQFGKQKYRIARYRVNKSAKQKQYKLSQQIADVAGSI